MSEAPTDPCVNPAAAIETLLRVGYRWQKTCSEKTKQRRLGTWRRVHAGYTSPAATAMTSDGPDGPRMWRHRHAPTLTEDATNVPCLVPKHMSSLCQLSSATNDVGNTSGAVRSVVARLWRCAFRCVRNPTSLLLASSPSLMYSTYAGSTLSFRRRDIPRASGKFVQTCRTTIRPCTRCPTSS